MTSSMQGTQGFRADQSGYTVPSIPGKKFQNKIYEIRGQRVMLNFDLAELYGTKTKRLKEAATPNPAEGGHWQEMPESN